MAGPIIYSYGGDEGSRATALCAWGLGSSGSEMLSYGPYPRAGTYIGGRSLAAPFAPYDFDTGASSFDGTGWARAAWPQDVSGFWRGAANGLAGLTFTGWYQAQGAGSGGTLMFVQSDAFSGADTSGVLGPGTGRGDNMVLTVTTAGTPYFWTHTFTLTLYKRSYNSVFPYSSSGQNHPRTAIETITALTLDTQPTPQPMHWGFARQMPTASNPNITPRLWLWAAGADHSQPAVGSCQWPGRRTGYARPCIIIGGDSPGYSSPSSMTGSWPFPTTTTNRLTNASVDAVCVWDRILTNGDITALSNGEPFV